MQKITKLKKDKKFCGVGMIGKRIRAYFNQLELTHSRMNTQNQVQFIDISDDEAGHVSITFAH